MDSTGEGPPIKQKKRYKSFMDPEYRENWTSAKTHASWMKRASQINTANSPSGSTENPVEDVSIVTEDDKPLEIGSLTNTVCCDHMDGDVDDMHLSDKNKSISDEDESIGDSIFNLSESSTDNDENEVNNSEDDLPHDRNNFDGNSIMFQASALKESDVMEMITGICVRYNLSYEVRKAIVDLTKCLAGPRYNNWRNTKYNIRKKYDPPENVLNYTFYCKSCKSTLLGPANKTEFKNEVLICRKCDEEHHLSMQLQNKFVYIDVKFQLTELLSNTCIQENVMTYIRQRNERNNAECSGGISDVLDSELYRKLNSKYSDEADEYLLTYNFNTDGMPIFNSSKRSSWPILLYVNELPPSERFKHVLLVALWVGDKEPTPSMMDTFLKQFTQEAIELFEEGIVIHNRERQIVFKFAPLCCAVDSVARPIIQNRVQYNGYHGCSWCYAHGKYLRGTVRYLFSETDANDLIRSHESHLNDLKKAEKFNKFIRGVKGDAIVLQLPQFDAVWGFPYEFMHGTLLGVQKQMTEMYSTQGSPIYLSKTQRTEVNARLTGITPIKKIQRLPRSLTDRCKWKASEWLSWSLFYCLPCYDGILRSDVQEHLALLIGSLFLLLQNNITDEELAKCEIDLLRFVAEFEILYGEEYVTFNIHGLLHIVQSVRMCGPLWATSAFTFESTNFHLKQQVSGPKGVDDQICKKYLQKNLWKWRTNNRSNSEVCRQYCKNLFAARKHCSTGKILGETVVLGLGRRTDNSIRYERCIYKGDFYHSTIYRPGKKTNDSAVQIITDECAEITAVVTIDDECYIDIRKMITENIFNVPHIFKVLGYSENTIRIPVCNIKEKLLLVTHANATYVCRIPNICYM